MHPHLSPPTWTPRSATGSKGTLGDLPKIPHPPCPHPSSSRPPTVSGQPREQPALGNQSGQATLARSQRALNQITHSQHSFRTPHTAGSPCPSESDRTRQRRSSGAETQWQRSLGRVTETQGPTVVASPLGTAPWNWTVQWEIRALGRNPSPSVPGPRQGVPGRIQKPAGAMCTTACPSPPSPRCRSRWRMWASHLPLCRHGCWCGGCAGPFLDGSAAPRYLTWHGGGPGTPRNLRP